MTTRSAITILFGSIFIAVMGFSPRSFAGSGISLNIGVNLPLPHVVIHEPPAVVVIPGTYAYFAPDVEVDMFFYHGYWYKPHNGHWYSAAGYNGPWKNINYTGVPHVLRNLPPDFRRTVRRNERIRYAELKSNWKTWERKKHWDRREYRHEVRDVRNSEEWEDNPGRHRGKGKYKW